MSTKRTAAIANGHACNMRLSKYSGRSPTLVRAIKLPNLKQPAKKKNSAMMTAKTVGMPALYKNSDGCARKKNQPRQPATSVPRKSLVIYDLKITRALRGEAGRARISQIVNEQPSCGCQISPSRGGNSGTCSGIQAPPGIRRTRTMCCTP